MAIAWITQEIHTFNYTPAEKHGDVRFITNKDYSPSRSSLHNPSLTQDIRRVLENFDPENDYIVPTGSPIVLMVVAAVLAEKGLKVFRILKWDNRDFMYVPMTIDIGGNNGNA